MKYLYSLRGLTIVLILSLALAPFYAANAQCASTISTFPNTEDFESTTLCGTASGCGTSCTIGVTDWSNDSGDDADWRSDRSGTPSSTTGPSVDNTLGTTSGMYLYVESSTCYSSEANLLSSCIDLTGKISAEVSFAYHMYGTSMGSLNVDISTDGGANFTSGVWTLSGNQGNTWYDQTVDLTPFLGSNQVVVRIRAVTGTSYWSDMAIDDIEIDAVAGVLTCPAPSALSASYTGTQATLDWTAGGSETIWDVEFGAGGFTPTGTPTDNNVTKPFVKTVSPVTAYDYYVRADCGGGDESVWLGPYSFTTPCAADVAPYTQSFDGTTEPACWAQSATSGGPWVFTGTTAYNGCASASDNTGNGGGFAWMDHSSTDAGVVLEMNDVDVSALTSPYLTFYYYMCGSGYTPINELYIEAYDGSGWNLVGTIIQGTTGWEEFSFDLSAHVYNTDHVRIRFRTESGGSSLDYYGDPALDDIVIDNPPSCVPPTALTATAALSSASLNWTAGGTETLWDVEVVTEGATPTGTPTDAGVTKPFNKTGLAQNTAYDYYVRANCGGGDLSGYEGPYTFTTLCNLLAGSYDIGGGANDYASVADAMNALSCGITAPVTMNIYTGTYNEKPVLNTIPGSSVTNTVTIRSQTGNAADVTITDPSSATNTDNYTFLIDGASYITFEDITFERSGSDTYGGAVRVENGGSNLSFDGCVFQASTTTSTFDDRAAGLNIYSTLSTALSNDISVTNSTFLNGTTGLFDEYTQTSTPHTSNLTVTGNTFTDQNYSGVYTDDRDDVIITNNVFTSGSSASSSARWIYAYDIGNSLVANGNTFNAYGGNAIYVYQCNNDISITDNVINSTNGLTYGIYLSSCVANSASDDLIVTGNTLGGTELQYGMYLSYSDRNSSNPGIVANNMITIDYSGSSTPVGIYNTSSDYVDLYNNNILVTGNSTSTSNYQGAIYISSSASTGAITIQNNNLVNLNTGSSNYAISISAFGDIGTISNNNYYAPNGSSYGYVGGTQSTYSDLVTATGETTTAVSIDPLYVSNSDLHVTNSGLGGAGAILAAITTDFDGDVRNSPPAIGADEITNSCPAPSALTATAALSSASLDWTAGGSETSWDIEVVIAGDSSSGTATDAGVTKPFNKTGLAQNTSYDYYVSAICGAGNYSIYTGPYTFTTQCNMLAGSYDVGGGNNDYATMAEAINGLACGITGPVTMNVYTGTYNEQLVLPAVTGASAVNTVTFRSQTGNAADVTISVPSSSSSTDNYTFLIDGAEYVTFEDITFERSGSDNYGGAVRIENGGSNLSFDGCVFQASTTTSTSSSYAVGLYVYTTSTSALSNNISITNSSFKDGTSGLYDTYTQFSTPHTSNINVTGNSFTDQTAYGAYFDDRDDIVFSNNTVTSNSTYYAWYGVYVADNDNSVVVNSNSITAYGSSGIYFNDCDDDIEVNGNTVVSTNSMSYAIYLTACDGSDATDDLNITGNTLGGTELQYGIYLNSTNDKSTANRGVIANNMITIDYSGTSIHAGIYNYGSDYIDLYNNNILVTGNGSYSSASQGPIVIATYLSTGAVNIQNNNLVNLNTGSSSYAISIASFGDIATISHNNYYAPNGSSYGYVGGTESTFADLVAATGEASTAQNVDPQFTSNSDLHVANLNLGGLGASIASITTDLDGDARNTPPAIGADEVVSTCPITSNLTATASLTSASLNWTAGGTETLWDVEVVTAGDIPTGTPTDVSVTKPFNKTGLAQNTSYDYYVRASCGGGDYSFFTGPFTFATNCVQLSGSYDIGGGNNDFASIDEATVRLACGITGPVIINIYTGVYNEQPVLSTIPGSSATNTVVFRSQTGNAADVTISTPSSGVSTDNYTFSVNGAEYVRFENITFERSGNNTYGGAVLIENGGSNLAFDGCVFQASTTTSTVSRNAVGLYVYSTLSTALCNDISVTNSTFLDGTTGLYDEYTQTSTPHTSNISATGNTFTGQSYYGMYFDDRDEVVASNNTITSTSSSTSWYGLYAADVDNSVVASGNSIAAANGYAMNFVECNDDIFVTGNTITSTAALTYGVYVNNCAANVGNDDLVISGNTLGGTELQYGIYLSFNSDRVSSNHGIVANNMITIDYSGNSSHYGMYNYGSDYVDFVHNNILVTGNSTSSSNGQGAIYIGSSVNTGGANVQNNNLVNLNTGSYSHAISISTFADIGTISNNNYYVPNGASYGYVGGTQSTFANLVAATGEVANAANLDPQYVTNADLHITNTNLMTAGVALTSVTTDYDGDAFGAPPVIGADEIVAQTVWTGTVDTDWFNGGNWTAGVPDAVTHAVVPDVTLISGNFPNIVGGVGLTAVSNNLTIDAGASVLIAGLNNVNLEINGKLTHNGVPDMGQGKVKFVGGTAHTILGTAYIRDLEITEDVTVTGNLHIKRELALVAGELDATGGTLVIASDATETAYVNDFTSGYVGTINGTLIAERYVAGNGRGFAYLGSGVDGATIDGDYTGDFSLATLNGGVDGSQVIPTVTCSATQLDASSPYGGIFDYRESQVVDCYFQGWHVRTTGSLVEGQGYASRVNAGTTVDVTGTYRTGNATSPLLSRTTSNVSGQIGYNLVSNPYLSELDAELLLTGNAGATDGNVYVWITTGPFAGTYQAYNSGNPGVVPSSGAFFVRSQANGNQLNFDQSMRVRNGATNNMFARQTAAWASKIDLTIEGNGYADKTIILFGDDFTHGMDEFFDAKKLKSHSAQPTLFTNTGIEDQFMNALPNNNSVQVVPMGLIPGTTGQYTITANELSSFAPTALIFLEDLKTGTIQNLMADNEYVFTANVNDDANRFLIHFVPAAAISAQGVSCNQTPSLVELDFGLFSVAGNSVVWDNYEVLDAQGTVVATGSNVNGLVSIADLAAGTYNVSLTIGGYNLTELVTINNTALVTAEFESSMVELEVGETVDFSNLSVGGSTYQWNFGDGNTSNDSEPQHTYFAPGVYDVLLTATSADCEGEYTVQLKVGDVVSDVELLDAENVTIYANGNQVFVEFVNTKAEHYELSIYNTLAQKVMEPVVVNSAIDKHKIDLNDIVSGYYFVRLSGGNKVITQKVFIAE